MNSFNKQSLLHPKKFISKNIFNELNKNNICKRCGVIFVKQQEDSKYILVVRGSYSGIWSLPKGKINDDESDEECASREVWEETGIIVDPNFLSTLPKIKIDHNIYFIYNLDKIGIDIKSFNFSVKDSEEISEIGWKNFEELSAVSVNKDIRNILTQTLIYY